MSEIKEPRLKRPKMSETVDNFIDNIINMKKNLHAVLGDEFHSSIPLLQVYTGHVRDLKQLSKIIVILNEKIQLKEMQHLKRARKKDVLLCPTDYVSHDVKSEDSVQKYLEEHIPELKDAFEFFKITEVPLLAPKLKRQHEEFSKIWSCNFHPNKYLEKLCGNEFFAEDELTSHRLYMGMTFEIARFYLSQMNSSLEMTDIILRDTNATVIVDPSTKSVVAVAFDNRQYHPVQHSAMLAIDNVAKTQNGGAWDTATDVKDVSLRGIEIELLVHLKEKFPNVKFGARTYLSKNALNESKMSVSGSPYLCTGYYVYLMREPCVMCSMGLVHARANRVFYCLKNNRKGALGSKTKLQSVSSLNHHFEVFTDFL